MHPKLPKFLCEDCFKPMNLFHVYRLNLIQNQAALIKIFQIPDPVKEETLFVKVEIENSLQDLYETVPAESSFHNEDITKETFEDDKIDNNEVKTEEAQESVQDNESYDCQYSDEGEFEDCKDNLETTLISLAQDNVMLQNK